MIEHHDTGLSRVLVISTRPDGIITSFNSAAERLLGVGADAVVGKVTPAAFHDPDELRRRREALAAGLGKPIQDSFGVLVARVGIGRMTEDEWTYLDRSGYRFPVFLSVSAIPDEAGHVLG
ncbi:MAG TPA: PAS domain-containing protein, partial [Nitrospira sp.]|nr:PAS domain-containing protein [Nitrospira sp.]